MCVCVELQKLKTFLFVNEETKCIANELFIWSSVLAVYFRMEIYLRLKQKHERTEVNYLIAVWLLKLYGFKMEFDDDIETNIHEIALSAV